MSDSLAERDMPKGPGGSAKQRLLFHALARIREQHLEQHVWEDRSELRIRGRVVLNLWRIFRSELKLSQYSIEAVVASVLGRQLPSYPSLEDLFSMSRVRIVRHVARRAAAADEVLARLAVVGRTFELARVIGIDFFSVISRGSQFRVESFMLRLGKPQQYVFLSPSRQQVADQRAFECLPLVMEPQSKFYTSPVLVFDFQSLYPSIVIAYNICFSTCLGRISRSSSKRLGVLENYHLSQAVVEQLDLANQLWVAPNGVMFAKRKTLRGLLPKMLQEILETRVMLKQSVKLYRDSRHVQRSLNAQQFALKMLANVTYGYTAASFSGRMPCSDVADTIVQTGRETLEKAIQQIEETVEWGARVVYGDTDSIFVELPGRSREVAFAIGAEIAREITRRNPIPIKLQFEKVFHPCILVAKKRYVGYMWETPQQTKPVLLSKGVEIVRRDSCPLVQDVMEKSVRLLFEDRNTLHLQQYLMGIWARMYSGSIGPEKYIFAKEVKWGTYSGPTLPPSALVAEKALKRDPRAIPRYGERIPYIVVQGPPGARLMDCVMHPLEYVAKRPLIHVDYYITKQIIPALDRLLLLAGIDIKPWYAHDFPKMTNRTSLTASHEGVLRGARGASLQAGGAAAAGTFFTAALSRTELTVGAAPPSEVAAFAEAWRHLSTTANRTCLECAGSLEEGEKCQCLACPVFFHKSKSRDIVSAFTGTWSEAPPPKLSW